jgi:hypothetical protein
MAQAGLGHYARVGSAMANCAIAAPMIKKSIMVCAIDAFSLGEFQWRNRR